jgi:acylphosphatase
VADEPDNLALHVRIHGKVQGVFYRNWTIEEATKRSLRGWVRNRSDGTVEAVFVGNPDQVRAMVTACRRGPPKAEVSSIVQIPGEYRPDESELPPGFRKLPTL